MSDVEVPELSSWVFDHPPEVGEVHKLLMSLEPVWGITTHAYIEYIQPLPQRIAIKDAKGNRTGEYREEWRLYMTVAGRLKMLNDAAVVNGWNLHIEPLEYILLDKVAPIQRTRIIVQGKDTQQSQVRYGTAKFGGGDYPVEKAETAALGRAIAQLGFGVLPGSGIASLEEVRDAQQARTTPERPPETRRSKEELKDEVLMLAEEGRQLRGWDQAQKFAKLAEYFKNTYELDIVKVKNEAGDITELDWRKVKDGHLIQYITQAKRVLADLRAQESKV